MNWKAWVRIFAPMAIFVALIFVERIPAQQLQLAVSDVSLLWPVPSTVDEVDALLSSDAAIGSGGGSIWPANSFDSVLTQAESTKVTNSAGRENQIAFANNRDAFKKRETWKVVGVRVDPSAPGTTPKLTEAFGTVPQIRLILQPVTKEGSSFKVHDVAAHLVFNFVERFDPPPTAGGAPRGVPDKAAFKAIIQDLLTLKQFLKDKGIETNGKLSVHPGLKSSVEFRQKLIGVLKTHLSEERLAAIAFMGLEPPEPWIFFAVAKRSGSMQLQPQATLGGKSAQMLTFRGGTHVMPEPTTTNIDGSKGVSTALLFRSDAANKLAEPVFSLDTRPRHDDIPDLIANPHRANFFNTDCMSCHTESSRRKLLSISPTDATYSYALPTGTTGVADDVLPKSKWNVRNFGWFPSGGSVEATVTVRTANESADAVDYINREYLPVVR